MMKLDIQISRQQQKFIDATEDEVLFGGAAGGGKSYGQLIDALLFALKWPGSRQLALRRTYSDLEESLIVQSMEMGLYHQVARYNEAKHRWTFCNGSTLKFGYCDRDASVYQYQSAQYDVVRFDELTHFSKFQYTYIGGRVRGTNPCPKQVKSSTNPGNIGHAWVKERFIDPGVIEKPFDIMLDNGGAVSARFIPAKIRDNPFLFAADPDYQRRLERQGEAQRRMLIDGEWDVLEGRFFTGFRRELHVVEPFPIPRNWRRYAAIDYGLDRFAALFFAVDEQGRAVQVKEFCESDLIVSKAAKELLAMIGPDEEPEAIYAPPDLWNRHSDTGKSTADIFRENGVPLRKASNDRVDGWRNLAEWLEPVQNEFGGETARLRFFSTCRETLHCLPLLQHDPRNPEDVAREPHELTHAPDALHYFLAGRTRPAEALPPPGPRNMLREVRALEQKRRPIGERINVI